MPVIASLEDLKSAQKEGVSIYALLSAPCSMLFYGHATPDTDTFLKRAPEQLKGGVDNKCPSSICHL
jgi:hypothetical protein